MQKLIAVAFAMALLSPTAAQAYIGPGVGVGAIAVVLGVLASVVMALVAVVWYPLKRLIRACTPAAVKSREEVRPAHPEMDNKRS